MSPLVKTEIAVPPSLTDGPRRCCAAGLSSNNCNFSGFSFTTESSSVYAQKRLQEILLGITAV